MIFHIGLNKTGTKSLTKALEILGYKASHGSEEIKEQTLHNIEQGVDPLYNVPLKIEAIVDNVAVSHNLPYIHKYYPKAEYIYTYRNTDAWLDSRERHVIKNQNNPDYKGNFLTVDRRSWRRMKEQHHNNIIRFARNQDINLLVLPICDGAGWQPLCEFLGEKIPNKHECKPDRLCY